MKDSLWRELISLCRTAFACCALWQYHRPGESHQEEYGFPEWGDKPNFQFPYGTQCLCNTVVMWTDMKNDKTETDEQAQFVHC